MQPHKVTVSHQNLPKLHTCVLLLPTSGNRSLTDVIFWAFVKILVFHLLPKEHKWFLSSRAPPPSHPSPSPSPSAVAEFGPGADPLWGKEDSVRHHPQGQRPCWPRQVQDPAADPPGPDQAEDRWIRGHVGDQVVSLPSLSVAITHSKLRFPHSYFICEAAKRCHPHSPIHYPLCLRMDVLLFANCTK